MKKTLLFIVIALCFAACDKIESPYLAPSHHEDVDVIFPDLDPSTVYRKVLFDEYTGHKCPNCPDGHTILNQMLSQYGDTLVAVCIHAGWFAETEAAPFNYNFSTPLGEQLYADYHISNNPQAVINRSGSPLDKSTWHSSMQTADRTLHAAIQIINQFDESEQSLKINTKTTMLESYDHAVLLSLLLVEDNIVKPQQVNNNVNEEYVHNHVLRAGVNDSYGEHISFDGMVSKDSSYLYGYSIDFNGTDWVPENCSVIAILLDESSKEVLQVEKAKVK
ncbi:MAG: Omp28 family outer membrane lipoprotein [Bacteroidales bacterium]|nr:Omp28 family outer membrane lipoprotein [Bacteroidales bacterium]